MTNPFDDPDAVYFALVNTQGQHSLWPAFAPVPAGWRVAHDADSRTRCLAYIDATWTDQRPSSLIAAQSRKEASTS